MCLFRDLAARNVLISDDNVAKVINYINHCRHTYI